MKKMRKNQYSIMLSSPLGKLGIIMHDTAVAALDFIADDVPVSSNTADSHVANALAAYFCDPAHPFNLPLHHTGTAFQQRVWNALREIPCGTTLTYGALAKKLNTSPRAIGQACRRNPTPIIVPCHRVTAVNHPGGYAGERDGKLFEIKQWLLKHEGI